MPDDHSHDDHGHGGTGKYWVVFVLLCILTTMSFLTFFDFWDQRVPVNVSRMFMMAVSCAKAMLVILFFMHVFWEANWKYVLTIPSAMMSVFLLLMLVPDVGCRYSRYDEERLLHAADPVVHHDVVHHGGDAHGAADDNDHAHDENADHN
jgi:cytochrome c oxidase subunit 4